MAVDIEKNLLDDLNFTIGRLAKKITTKVRDRTGHKDIYI